jgi:hypothetical protein
MAKVYLKKGNLNYKERKYITAIEKALNEKGLSQSEFNPATNFGELETLYNKYCVEDVEFTEIKSDKTEGTSSVEDEHKNFRDGAKETVEQPSTDVGGDEDPFTDPFNQGEVIVRDYVGGGDGSMKDPNAEQQEVKTTFEEPTTFHESFEMPKHDEGEKKSGGSSLAKKEGKDKKEVKSEPVNPAFDEMSTAKKKKSTKKMARAIVEGVCKLAEFGSIWWVTKDITEDKVIEYEINDTIDVQILLSLDENQQVTVKNWFAKQVKDANEILRIEDGDKDDLVDSLYEVMLEKGIAPTPMQELIINAVSTIVIGLGVKAFAMGQQINSVLGQLKALRVEQKEAQNTQSEEDHFDNHSHANTNTHTHTHTETTTDTDTNSGDTESKMDAVEFTDVEDAFDGEKMSTDLTIQS